VGHTKVFAWAYGCSVNEVLRFLPMLGGNVGAVLYRDQYEAAMEPRAFIAFIGSEDDAHEVVRLSKKGARFMGAIYLDERNLDMTLAAYAASASVIKNILATTGIPFFGMSTKSLLSQAGHADLTFLREEVSRLGVPVLCWNATGSRATIEDELGRIKMWWFLSPHPWRFTLLPLFNSGWVNWLLDHLHGITARWYVGTVAKREDVYGVGLWCLKAYGPGHFGLFTESGKLTGLGRAVRRALG